MLALIAGTGDLPAALLTALPEKPLICALDGTTLTMMPDLTFRVEKLGGFLKTLKARGVTTVCMAGGIARPKVSAKAMDFATLPLLPTIVSALRKGDDGALRAFIAVLERQGFTVLAAHEIAPSLLPLAGVQTKAKPRDWHSDDAIVGEGQIAKMAAADLGQACVVRAGQVAVAEDSSGTDAMLKRYTTLAQGRSGGGDPFSLLSDGVGDIMGQAADWLTGDVETPLTADNGILFKAPKPNQDRRADLPVIGLGTAKRALAAGLDGIVIEAGGVMVLNLPDVLATLNAGDLFLWVRPVGGATKAKETI